MRIYCKYFALISTVVGTRELEKGKKLGFWEGVTSYVFMYGGVCVMVETSGMW
jgi:hypothetical protein